LDPDRFAPYAVQQWLQNRTAVTFTRVLGAGANRTSTDIAKTKQYGVVKSAGFILSGAGATVGTDSHQRARGCVKFIAGTHAVRSQETQGFPVFTDNDSFDVAATANTEDYVNLIRGMLLFATGTTAFISQPDIESSFTPATTGTGSFEVAQANSSGLFTIILSSSATTFTNELAQIGGNNQVKLISASLDPSSDSYLSKVLNTDPLKFQSEQHLLYADFAVADELASNASLAVAIMSGSLASADKAALAGGTQGLFEDAYGRFDARYTTATTTDVISQPFGNTEYSLFRFESLDDGTYGNDKVKISIANLVASSDAKNKFGKFDVQVRRFSDTDTNPAVLETYPGCNLDPTSDRYVAAVIGDKKVQFNFDAEIDDERRLEISGKYPNVSSYIRVVMNAAVTDGDVPDESLPFGFRGIPVIKTNDALTAYSSSVGAAQTALAADGRTLGSTGIRLTYSSSDQAPRALIGLDSAGAMSTLSGSIVPPLPFRYKVTRGATAGSTWEGDQGSDERVDNRFYWGTKFTRMPETASISTPALDPNISSLANPLIGAYTKFLGIKKLDMLVSGAGADAFNNNKFTMARIGIGPDSDNGDPDAEPTAFSQITGSAKAHMLGAVYVRNGIPHTARAESATQNYVIGTSTQANRVSLATLLASSSTVFNRFTPYAKFTLPLYGGFDGFNILDSNIQYGNDRSTSQEAGGLAASGNPDTGLVNNVYVTAHANPMGAGLNNNSVSSFRTAIRLNTDPFVVYTNLLAVPGVREPLITDYATDETKAYSKAMYIMDIPEYGMKNGTTSTRLYDDSTLKPDVLETAEQFDGRTIDSNYAATYFPSVVIDDASNNRRVTVPASVAALGAIGFNDRVSYPWFAPAGFNRGALDFVKNVGTRLTQQDRDTLYDNRINPIATFPTGGFVIFGQKTMQQAASALDRVNVRRMLLEVKRLISGVARNLLFEQNNATTRGRFTQQITPLLSLVQAQAGIESFQIVCDSSNNSELDAEQNRMNARIVVVPTRAIEFIAIDFIITNAGVSFE